MFLFLLKEQQQQLLRLQQAAKQQLTAMEQIRGQCGQMSFNNQQNGGGPAPDYDNVDDVQNDVSTLMNRMKTLTDFIQNQNELASMLGEDKSEVMEEQLLLQQKLNELKNKKQQMVNLVSELQNMGGSSLEDGKIKHHECNTTPTRNIPIEYERIVPIELVGTAQRNNKHQVAQIQQQQVQQQPIRYATAAPVIVHKPPILKQECDADIEEQEGAAGVNYDLIGDRISEINAMKNQLNRLKEMMNTVKLIEQKNGDVPSEDVSSSAKSSRSQSHFESTPVPQYENDIQQQQHQQQFKPVNNNPNVTIEQPQRDDESEMDERVRALHSMTQDLRLQAISLAQERDRLKDIKNEIYRRNEGNEKNIKQNRDLSAHPSNKEQEQDLMLKSEYEAKKKEFEKLVEKLDTSEECSNQLSNLDKSDDIYYPDNWRRVHNLSSTSSLRSGQGGHQSEPSSSKPNQSSLNQGKDSTDSGAADVLGMSVEAGSLQSGSSRGFSVPPPMRNIGARDSSKCFITIEILNVDFNFIFLDIFLFIDPWRKTSQQTSRISSINQPNVGGFDNSHEPFPSWYYHNNNYYNQGYNNMGPAQSPHCHYHHHMNASGVGGDNHYCRPIYHHPTSISGNTSNDPMLLQQFIQTQQMLINSVSQCNQLLWDQQRDINNLNSAVLLVSFDINQFRVFVFDS